MLLMMMVLGCPDPKTSSDPDLADTLPPGDSDTAGETDTSPPTTGETGLTAETGDTGATRPLARRQLGDAVADDLVIAPGPEPSALVGWTTAVGDFTGDGTLDLAVSYELTSPATSRAAILPGPLAADLDVVTGALSVWEDVQGDGYDAPFRLATVGDLDSDGVDDLVITVMPFSARYPEPSVWLVSGIAPSGLATDMAFSALSQGQTSYIGRAAAVGAVGRKGAPRLALGAEDGNGGAVLLLDSASLPASGFVEDLAVARWTGTSFEGVGHALAVDVDIDGDGIDDVLVGSSGANGVVTGPARVVLGGAADVDAPIADLEFFRADADGVEAVAGGDLDGDGQADLVAALYKSSRPGTVGTFLSASGGGAVRFDDAELLVDGVVDSGWLGHQTRIADLDLDGQSDVVLGNRLGASFSAGGAVRVFYGPVPTGHITAASADLNVEPAIQTTGNFSWDIEVADLTGDGLPDLIGGAPWELYGGAVYGLLGLAP